MRMRLWRLLLSIGATWICSVTLACGGKIEIDSENPAAARGGSNTNGGSSAGGDPNAVGGSAGCANREAVYPEGTTFPEQSKGINDVSECIPSCGQSLDTVQAMPAGPCTAMGTCVFMMLPPSGIWSYFLCACVTPRTPGLDSPSWSCASVSGSP